MNEQYEQFPSLRWLWALRAADINPKVRLLGFTLMSFANAEGQMRPTLETLQMRHTNDDGKPVSDRTIKRWRGELVELGWLSLVKKGDGRGRHNASVYTLSFPPETVTLNGDTNGDMETGTTSVPPSETVSEKTLISVVDERKGSQPAYAAAPNFDSAQTNGNGSLGLKVDQAHRTPSKISSTTPTETEAPPLGALERSNRDHHRSMGRLEQRYLNAWHNIYPDASPQDVIDAIYAIDGALYPELVTKTEWAEARAAGDW